MLVKTWGLFLGWNVKCQDSVQLKVMQIMWMQKMKFLLTHHIWHKCPSMLWKQISMQNTFYYEFRKKYLSKWIFNFMHLLHCWALSPQPGWGTMLLWPKRIFWDTEAFCELLSQAVPRLHTPQRGWSNVCRTGLAFRGEDCFWRKVLCFLRSLSSQ